MAYSPIEQGALLKHRVLKLIASRHASTPAQVTLSWLLQKTGIVVIPKASSAAHVRENRASLDLKLTAEYLTELDRAFPAPAKKIALEMI